VNRSGASGLLRTGWWLWRALLRFNTLGLLAVGLYTALASSSDGPSATPILMAGLLSLCAVVLALVSLVDAVLWAWRARSGWWIKAGMIALAPTSGVLVFVLLMHASDPAQAGSARWLWLTLFALCVVAAHWLNTHAVSRFRSNG
jgi:hypothetical protein